MLKEKLLTAMNILRENKWWSTGRDPNRGLLKFECLVLTPIFDPVAYV
jgi:hypothetical protein